jgi:hypothetical protein
MIGSSLTISTHLNEKDARITTLQVQDHPHNLNLLFPVALSTAGQKDTTQGRSAIDDVRGNLPLAVACKQQPVSAISLSQGEQRSRRHNGNVCETCNKVSTGSSRFIVSFHLRNALAHLVMLCSNML